MPFRGSRKKVTAKHEEPAKRAYQRRTFETAQGRGRCRQKKFTFSLFFRFKRTDGVLNISNGENRMKKMSFVLQREKERKNSFTCKQSWDYASRVCNLSFRLERVQSAAGWLRKFSGKFLYLCWMNNEISIKFEFCKFDLQKEKEVSFFLKTFVLIVC